ncbi:J domain-containing protein [Sphingomonas sp.]|uniref:J domain-containing protein n=1 Tax=Sphingomonas sp. TaxID=28214 RepID=UPI003AFF62D2
MKLLVALAIIVGVWWLAQRRRPALSPDEARALLGVSPGATRDDIAAAHRRLIARAPRRGRLGRARAARQRGARPVADATVIIVSH